ncbi:FMN reductase (NADPH) [bioreactor metagenome]|uniref:FMN reductase (NADPH) n=1 Tax=bioreactor metagenome TaxID=1076179 RepID=A0A644ZZG8_9ZZZZ
MSHILRTVVVNGSLGRPSRTRTLLDVVSERLADKLPLSVENIDLVDLVPDIGTALSKDGLSPKGLAALQAIEEADFLIVGSPVFRASLPGLLKHLFDLVELNALRGKPVLLAATGGSPRHSLVLDHQLRPLFGFFSALTLPIGVYSTPEDIQNGEVVSEALQKHIDLTVELATPVLKGVQQRHAAAARQPVQAPELQAA